MQMNRTKTTNSYSSTGRLLGTTDFKSGMHMSIETVVARASCRETEKRFTTMAFFSGFLEQLLLGKMVMMGNVHHSGTTWGILLN